MTSEAAATFMLAQLQGLGLEGARVVIIHDSRTSGTGEAGFNALAMIGRFEYERMMLFSEAVDDEIVQRRMTELAADFAARRDKYAPPRGLG